MSGDNISSLDFGEKVLPDIESLLQISLALTENGRDAVELMREAMAEAYHSWRSQIPETDRKRWLCNILISTFFSSFQQHGHKRISIIDIKNDDCPAERDRFHDASTPAALQWRSLPHQRDDDLSYLGAIADLPSLFRSAMILSYLEGFSSREIADLAGMEQHAVESLLDRGHGLLREELFEHLMNFGQFDTPAES
jgi:DNA-directed RNA polymerase specialized sigma24 family protein